jgi:hypothetical protein
MSDGSSALTSGDHRPDHPRDQRQSGHDRAQGCERGGDPRACSHRATGASRVAGNSASTVATRTRLIWEAATMTTTAMSEMPSRAHATLPACRRRSEPRSDLLLIDALLLGSHHSVARAPPWIPAG